MPGKQKKPKTASKTIRERLEARKTRIEIGVGLVTIILGVVGLFGIFHPFKSSPEAKLEVVDFYADADGPYPKLTVKLRNTGGSIALLKKAELLFEESKVKDGDHAAAEVKPAQYSWLITPKEVSDRHSSMQLSRRVDANDADNLEFVVGFEKLNSTLDAKLRLRLEYNQDQTTLTEPVKVSVRNAPGVMPVFMFSENPEELLRTLQKVETSYTVRQIIEELTKRKYEPAAPVIKNYLSSGDADVKAAAVAYYGQVKFREAVPEVLNAIADGSPLVRERISKVLVFYGEDVIADLERLMGNGDPAVRELAVAVLGELNTPKSEALLLRALDDRGVAGVAFGEETLVASVAIRSLMKIKSKKIESKIPKFLLNEKNLGVKLAAIEAVQELEIKSAVPLLVRMLDSEKSEVRQSAYNALVRLTGKTYEPTDRAWRRNLGP